MVAPAAKAVEMVVKTLVLLAAMTAEMVVQQAVVSKAVEMAFVGVSLVEGNILAQQVLAAVQLVFFEAVT